MTFLTDPGFWLALISAPIHIQKRSKTKRQSLLTGLIGENLSPRRCLTRMGFPQSIDPTAQLADLEVVIPPDDGRRGFLPILTVTTSGVASPEVFPDLVSLLLVHLRGWTEERQRRGKAEGSAIMASGNQAMVGETG